MSMTRSVLVLLVSIASTVPLAQVQTGQISGVVVDAATGAPIDQADVSVTPADAPNGVAPRVVSTGAGGRFSFGDLSVSVTYAVYATRAGYQDARYGARGTARQTAVLVVPAPDGAAPDVSIHLAKWNALSGRVVDEHGRPVAGVPVRVLTEIHLAGRPQLAAGPIVTTDDDGAYRFPRLPAAAFLVQVPSVKWSVPADPPVPTRAANATSVAGRRATPLDAPGIRLGSSRLVSSSYPKPPAPLDDGHRRSYPPMFAPSSRTVAGAGRVVLGDGEERGGVDVTLVPERAFRVTGQAIGNAVWLRGLTARLLPEGLESLGMGSEEATAHVGDDGRFEFLDVPSGRYRVALRPTVPELTRGAAAAMGLPQPPGWVQNTAYMANIASAPAGSMLSLRTSDGADAFDGVTTVDVGDRDVTGVLVTLEPTRTLRGRVIVDNDPGVPPPIVRAEPASGAVDVMAMPRVLPPVDGVFEWPGLRPARYVVRVSGGQWSVADVIVDGLHVGQRALDLTGELPREVLIHLIVNRASLSGSAHTAKGIAVRSGIAVLFPADRALWTDFGFNTDRMATTPVIDGAFMFARVPPDDYLVACVEGLPEDWRHLEVLGRLAQNASAVSVKGDRAARVMVRLATVSR